ncbi:MAG: glycosyltransferase [Bacteroidia bacterium]|nr:glycosyltransferase [Sphingobacteriaceae bacterium]MBP9070260.1 glycosyltransferase [Bacteroidia bacterium]
MIELSIITINYNNVNGLKRTIDSVLEQTYGNIEYIIIDNVSNDGSAELVKTYGNKITKFVSEKDTGVYNAQNKGIALAKGNYLLFLNSGDFLCDKDVLQNVFNQKPTEDIVYGNMRINWGNNSVSNGFMPDQITKEQMYKDTLWHPVSFIKRSLFEKHGTYNENYKLVADYDFFFKTIIKENASTKHVNVFIAEFSTDGLSSLKKSKEREQEERRKVQESYLTPDELQRFEKECEVKESMFTKIKNWIKEN